MSTLPIDAQIGVGVPNVQETVMDHKVLRYQCNTNNNAILYEHKRHTVCLLIAARVHVKYDVYETLEAAMRCVLKMDYGKVHGTAEVLSYKH